MPKQIDLFPIVEKLRNYFHAHKRLPSYSEMQKLFGYKSKGGVSGLTNHLLKEGVLVKNKLGQLIAGPSFFPGLKLLGSVKAGFPSPAEEELLDTLTLDEFLVKNPTTTYLVRVSGDSMIDAGIMPNDLVLVEKGRQASIGDIVIANVDGEWTMKFYEKINGKVVLKAANKKYPAIQPRHELTIGGIVVANIRKYKRD